MCVFCFMGYSCLPNASPGPTAEIYSKLFCLLYSSALTFKMSSWQKYSHVKQAWFPSVQHRLSCEICHKSFITTRDYIGHKNARHLNVKPFLCNFCGNGFAYKRSVDFHQKNGKCPAMIKVEHIKEFSGSQI